MSNLAEVAVDLLILAFIGTLSAGAHQLQATKQCEVRDAVQAAEKSDHP
jgi:hypothetical protein